MKRLILLMLFAGWGLRAEPTFLGVMSTTETGTFFLVGGAETVGPKWLKLGQSFDGYVLSDYREKEESLVLKKDAQQLLLKLRVSKVRDLKILGRESELLEIARREVAQRENDWMASARFDTAKRHNDAWFVVAARGEGQGREFRLVVLTDDGRVRDYVKFDASNRRQP